MSWLGAGVRWAGGAVWAWGAALAVALFLGGAKMGAAWQAGVYARAQAVAADALASDVRFLQRQGAKAAAGHAEAMVVINKTLGDQRAKIAKLSGRECLGAGTVSMLNGTATGQLLPTVAGEPDGAAAAVAAGDYERYATDADAADAIAICRAGYAGLASQLNAILDIEGARLTRAGL